MAQRRIIQTIIKTRQVASLMDTSSRSRKCKYHHWSFRDIGPLVALVLVANSVHNSHQQQLDQQTTNTSSVTVPLDNHHALKQVEKELTQNKCCDKSCEYPTKRLLLLQEDQTTNRTSKFRAPEMSEPIFEPIAANDEQKHYKTPSAGGERDGGAAGNDGEPSREWFARNLTRAHGNEASLEHGVRFIRERLSQRRRNTENPSAIHLQQQDYAPIGSSENALDFAPATKRNSSGGGGGGVGKWEPINERTTAGLAHRFAWKPAQLVASRASSNFNRLPGPILPYNLPRPRNGAKLIRLADFLPIRKLLPPLGKSFDDLQASAHSQDISLTDMGASQPLRHQQPWPQVTSGQANLAASNAASPWRSIGGQQQQQPPGRADLLLALENYRHDSINSQLPSSAAAASMMIENHQQSGDHLGDIGGSAMTYSLMPTGPAHQQQQQQLGSTDGEVAAAAAASEASNAAEQLLNNAMKQLGGVQSLESIQSLLDTNLAQSLEDTLKGISGNLEAHNKNKATTGSDQSTQNREQQQQKQLAELMNLVSTNQQQQQRQQQQQQQPNGHQMPMPAQNSFVDLLANNIRPTASPYNGLPIHSRPLSHQPLPTSSPMGYVPLQQQQQASHHYFNNDNGHGQPEESQFETSPEPMHAPQRKRKRSKSSPKSPQIKMQKRPRAARGPQQKMHEIDSQQDHQPSATFHKYKYPYLYRPDDEDEEEGETELNIRFFNNFSRMGPLGGLARVGGTATVVMSLAFLILSNLSLAATVIAHGIAGILRNLGQNPDRTKITSREAKQLGAPTTTTPTTTTTTTASPNTQTQLTRRKLDDKIRAFSKGWT